jgi:hypothetical protein
LAEDIGKAYTTVNNFITGRTGTSPETIKTIADYLKISEREVELMAREEPNGRMDFAGGSPVQEVPIKYVVDPEFQAMDEIWKILKALSPEAKKRVLDVIHQRLAETEKESADVNPPGPDGGPKVKKIAKEYHN